MNVPSTEALLAELYGAMQTFRGLGFPSDNLYVAFNIQATAGPYEGKKCMGLVLRWQGKEFSYFIAPVKNPRRFGSRWVAFAQAANGGDPNDPKLQKLVNESFCRRNVTDLLLLLHDKGIEPPLGAN